MVGGGEEACCMNTMQEQEQHEASFGPKWYCMTGALAGRKFSPPLSRGTPGSGKPTFFPSVGRGGGGRGPDPQC